jgi:hypothetical protein
MYHLGLDVLKDVLLLARADYLLAGGTDGVASGSNVSRMAQVWNADTYQHIELIWNGVNPSYTQPSVVSRAAKKARSLRKKFLLNLS